MELTRIGPVQAKLLDRASRGWVLPANYLERRALRRLTARGVMAPVPSYPDVWRRTDGTA